MWQMIYMSGQTLRHLNTIIVEIVLVTKLTEYLFVSIKLLNFIFCPYKKSNMFWSLKNLYAFSL
jgi:hypothetical protein